MKKNAIKLASVGLTIASFNTYAIDDLSELPIWVSIDVSKVSSDSRDKTQAALTNANTGLTISQYDEDRTAWSISGGYQLNPNLSIDVGYMDLGEVKMAATGQTLQPNTGAITIVSEHPVTAQGAFIASSFYHAFNAKTHLQMQFGVWFWSGEYDIDINNQRYTKVKSSGEDIIVNLNLQHEIVKKIALTGGIKMIVDNDIADPSLTIGAKYSF